MPQLQSSFQVPDVEALCLSCGTTHAGDLVHEDVFSFRLALSGARHCATGICNSDQEHLVEGGDVVATAAASSSA